jgi:signal transduction histidine kinase
MPQTAWFTQQLAEFVAAVSSAPTEASAALAAVERAAEALDAEVAAIVCDGEVVAAVGYPEGAAPAAELEAVTPGDPDREVVVPGVGSCPAAAVALEHPAGGSLVVARSGGDGISTHEAGLLRGMGHVTSMTMRMLRLLDEQRRLADEQAALRRVATLVAGQAAAQDIFAAVAEEVGQLLGADVSGVCRYETDASTDIVATWSAGEVHVPLGRVPLEGQSVTAMVARTGRAARLDTYDGATGALADLMRERGIRSSVGAPIIVDGRVWGAMITASAGEPLPEHTEGRLAAFTELVATAISNAQGRTQLAASRARVVATADETRRRIERDLHDGIQQRLIALALDLQAARDAARARKQALPAQVAHVEEGLKTVLDELREISRGVHPAILSEGGLGPALRSVARRAALPVELELGGVGRLPEPVEVAAYYVVCEALANAAKHSGASVAYVELEIREGTLHLAVRDDGVGGADPARGSGLVGLTDRVEAVGGTIAVTSPPGEGTSILVRLPAEPGGGRAAPRRVPVATSS